MNLNLHKNARTTPAIRQERRESTQSERELAREYHLHRATVRQWRRRENGQDASHRPHHLHATLTPAQEIVVIDRASRWVYVAILDQKTAENATAVLQRLVDKAPFKIQTVLTDNGQEFTDRCCATGERDPTGRHRFDRVCDNNGIEHRLIKPRHPQTNGRVERFNGRISAVLATTHFDAAQRLEDTLSR